MFDIYANLTTTNGKLIEVVYLRNKPEDVGKMCGLRDDMIRNGWCGNPVILIDAGDHHIALNGSHRLAAAAGLNIELKAVILDQGCGLTEERFALIDSANDDDDLLAALGDIVAEAGDQAEAEWIAAEAIMMAEVANNAAQCE